MKRQLPLAIQHRRSFGKPQKLKLSEYYVGFSVPDAEPFGQLCLIDFWSVFERRDGGILDDFEALCPRDLKKRTVTQIVEPPRQVGIDPPMDRRHKFRAVDAQRTDLESPDQVFPFLTDGRPRSSKDRCIVLDVN